MKEFDEGMVLLDLAFEKLTDALNKPGVVSADRLAINESLTRVMEAKLMLEAVRVKDNGASAGSSTAICLPQ